MSSMELGEFLGRGRGQSVSFGLGATLRLVNFVAVVVRGASLR